MGRVHVLDRHIANKIAAGEVVERPASVVKELVENSIDAGSTSVSVEIDDGGCKRIRVTDNGSGIHEDDVKTAFLSHATSKISDANDLFSIATLGFRGEALPSIASVAQITLRTRERDAETGTLLRINGGEIIEFSPCGAPDGTSVEVENLFYNVPARLKFLKSQRSETGYVTDYIQRMIIAAPHIAFKLTANGKLVCSSLGDGDLKNALYGIYGAQILEHLRRIDYDDGYLSLSGYVGTQEIARQNRNQQTFIINGRYVRSLPVSYAVTRAFDTRLMVGRHPFFAICMSIDAEEIDVNVHPTKMEVRFKSEERVKSAIFKAARTALDEVIIPRAELDEKKPFKDPAARQFKPAPNIVLPESKKTVFPSMFTAPSTVLHDSAGTLPLINYTDIKGEAQEFKGFFEFTETKSEKADDTAKDTVETKPCKKEERLDVDAEPYRIIGCLFNTYWLIEQGESLFMVDQHAAHERILYESYTNGEILSNMQYLLVPEAVTLTPFEYNVFDSNRELFSELGFIIEDFGPLSVTVRAIPGVLGETNVTAFLRDAIDTVSRGGAKTAIDIKRDKIIQSACKHAIKAGDYIDADTLKKLLKDFSETGAPLTCPHGRPVMVEITGNEIKKLFHRIV